VAFAGPVRVAEIVGAVRSITTVFADAIALGPVVVVPVTEFAFSRSIRAPSVQPETVTVKVVPEEAETFVELQDALPPYSKSDAAIPVTDCDIIKE
jgi:hypothetical protein